MSRAPKRAEDFDPMEQLPPNDPEGKKTHKRYDCASDGIACANANACLNDQKNYYIRTTAHIAPFPEHRNPNPNLHVEGAMRIGPEADVTVEVDEGGNLSVRDMYGRIRDAEANMQEIESNLQNKEQTVKKMNTNWESAAPLYAAS